ncbi:MAG: LysM peptidoglycan-binding domain-containing protein [Anaerolineales bacterium]|uniref:GH25 family lysozyme n=1 Tax=Candidatus Villigracilis proximus TaxID=3140683 RepID=UPI0031363B43|nr:LysM peptidoglycan-binding domain-containing protein [Anaerolineales bacterium]
MATVPGIDVSYWDAGIDWPKVRATGQRFMVAKATEGITYKDPTFDDNWFGAKSAGLLRGAYHFFRCNVDARKQADYFIDYVKTVKDNGELPPVLDLETHDGMRKEKIVPAVKIWLDRVESAFGKKPIIYSGQYFLQDYLVVAGGGPPAWAKDYPLWLAQYPNQYQDGMKPYLPRGWFNWIIWQYSDKGKVNGINASADMNIFNGTLEELYKFAGASIPDQKPKIHTITKGDSFESIANAYGVTVRELVMANPQLLVTGDKLTVPVAVAIPQESASTSTPVAGPGDSDTSSTPKRTYTVKAGDTLSVIAVKHSVTVAAIASANDIKNINSIKVGQVLVIP